MTVIADIREFGTIETNADAEDIKSSQLVSLKNLRPVGGTKLIKTFGFGSKISTAVSSTFVRNIITYVEEHLTYPAGYRYFVVIINNSKVVSIQYWDTDDPPNWKTLTLGSVYYHKTDINPILMHEKVIRFLPGNVGEAAVGHESKGIWYGYIDRNYFWNSDIKTVMGFVVSQTTPSKDGFVISSKVVTLETTATGSHTGGDDVAALIDSTKSWTISLIGLTVYNLTDESHGVITGNTPNTVAAPLEGGTHNSWYAGDTYYIGILAGLSDDTYYYKITAMFDGIQETLLPTDYISIDTDGDNKGVLLQTTFDISSVFNERITSFNIYRSTNAISGYTKISSVGLLDTDPNLTYNTGSISGWGLFVKDKEWTANDKQNKFLIVKGLKYTINSNTTDVLTLASAILDANKIWGGVWAIINSLLYANGRFESDDTGSWTLTKSDGTATASLTRSAVDKYEGSYSYLLQCTKDDVVAEYNNAITVEINTDYFISIAIHNVNCTIAASLQYKVGVGGSWTSVTNVESSSGNWSIKTKEFNTGAETAVYIRLKNDTGNTLPSSAYFDSLFIGKLLDSGTDGYGGYDTLINDDFNFYDDQLIRYMVMANYTTTYIKERIIENVKKALRFDSTLGVAGSSIVSYICRNYLWIPVIGDKVDLWFYDDGLLPTIAHPLENIESIKVNGKFAKIIQGLLFKANVVLDPGGKNEVHNSAFTFSLLNQIDVTPIDLDHIMFLPDREGGEITGLAEQFGSAVFFKKYAIFKLIITNPAVPSSWILKESIFNAGNVASQGVVECGNMIYFCSVDGIYKLVPNFESATDDTPLIKNRISESINDHYLDLSLEQKEGIKGIYNQKNNEITWYFTKTDVWAFNIITGNWREIGTSVDCDLVCLDEETNVLVYNKTDKKVYSSGEKESVTVQLKTKTFSISDIRKEIIRLCNITYQSEAALTVNLRTENKNAIVKALTLVSNSKIETKKLSLKYRAQKFNLEVIESSNSTDDVEIDRMKIEGD